MNMAGACERWQERTPTQNGKRNIQFISSFSSVPTTGRTTIRLRDLYDPKPQPAKAPVQIRPPSPRAPPAKGPTLQPSFSNDPMPIMRKRAQSLPLFVRREKAPRSLQVRFVDSLGLELEDVKFFKVQENPLIPPHVITKLMMSSELTFGKSLELSMPYFKPCFPDSMRAQPGFLKRLCDQKVVLDGVICSEMGITGTIQVLNLAFEKEVTVHYSFTNWRTHTNTAASWVSSGYRGECDVPDMDIFCFRLPVPPFILQPGALLEFAICYKVKGFTYWDNNDGQNFKLSCHSYKLKVPKECEDSMLHFT